MPRLKKPKAEEAPPAVDAAWFHARAKEVGTAIAQISAKAAGHKDLLGRSLLGDRQFKPSEIVALHKALKAPLSVIFMRLGYDITGAVCPLLGTVNEHARISFVNPDQRTVPAPTDLHFSLAALLVETTNTALHTMSGTYLYYEPASGVRPDSFGRLSVVEMGDHDAAVIGYLDRAAVGKGRVVLPHGLGVVETEQLKSATPVRWTRAT